MRVGYCNRIYKIMLKHTGKSWLSKKLHETITDQRFRVKGIRRAYLVNFQVVCVFKTAEGEGNYGIYGEQQIIIN